MKKILTAFALATLVASPAFAAKSHQRQVQPQYLGAQAYASAPGTYVGPRGAVISDGRYVGQDPDQSIRFQLLRDANASEY